ncbi:isoleucine--tRNA ligase [Aureibacter tunicatorum]|uniref:Isoleucine--tRNA ligase n=1 Tax=Aureibacter tunicatorum TaxID=866807 RepID=A0AAE3XKK9_9BACT|nr:isoleucine--tRNA ligase [Aureibacter tunicatorum]MDR6237645.1 isoleucyl-tRNA synthetase [Aureibacter tunicatorum]BDD02680.1 isoleucine--tRNA ligase [Aureibacter tunicatorum]
MKYNEYKQVNYAQIAEEVLSFWKENEVFQKSVETREGNPTFTFFEGPPSANGVPGIHHVMARTVKDIFCRYKTLKGFQVKRKGGWDTHGLPVELQVEKELGITKEDIGKKISVEEYNAKCRESVMKFKSKWDDLTEKMGYWVDLDNPYITFDRDYMETLWHLIKLFYEKGLLYKGYTIQPYSPAAGTGLSSHELNQPGCYRDVKDTSITAQFKVKGTENDYFIAWTTTPWTLPANSALAINRSITYAKVKTFNQYTHEPINVILAKDRIGSYFNKKAEDLKIEDYKAGDKLIPFEIIEEFKGDTLIGQSYEQLMPYIPLEAPAFTVVHADYVSTEDGTGIVHIAKTFGADDFQVCVQNNIPGITILDENGDEAPIVDRQGRLVKEITDFAGMYVKNYEGHDESDPNYKSTDVLISIKLKEENKAFRVEKYEHSYPHCWRTDKPVLYYPLSSWFIRTTEYKDKLIELNKTINWKPASTGQGRFGNWLENLVDWNLSRSRYWGTPLPIWRTEDGKEEICIGSLQELKDEVAKAIEAGFMTDQIGEDFDLHRPYVDDIYLVSPSGQKMTRETDLIDVWFDSGAMPYAQWHFPFENQEIFGENYPADFIAEGVDQTRGWFFTLHAIAVMLFDSVAFKNVIANGLVLDKNGNKMSKRLGNGVDPFETLQKFGPDATRWYMISNANPWDNLKFDIEGVAEVQRKLFGTLQNTYSFFALYANLDGFTYEGEEIPLKDRPESDQWILSKLNSLKIEVDEAYSTYEPTRAARLIQGFVSDQLSNWYVRLNRKRFWKGEYNDDKKAAYQTLYTCLETIAKLGSPIAPFYMDKLYRDLNAVSGREKNLSVHLAKFPKVTEGSINKELEHRQELAQTVSSLVHSLRKKDRLKVRQPLQKILIPVLNEEFKHQIQAVEDIIKTEVNIKDVEFIDDTSGILVKSIKPNFKTLGKAYGPKMKAIVKVVNGFGKDEIAAIEKEGHLDITLEGGDEIKLLIEDVVIQSQDIPGWSVASENGVTVALDINLTDELKAEGLARDFVNRIQNLRKDSGLEVQDKINIRIEKGNEFAENALNTNRDYICEEVQALSLEFTEKVDNGTEMDIDGVILQVSINS